VFRFGPGMVVFWFDVVDEMWHVLQDDFMRVGILLANRMPRANEIIKLNLKKIENKEEKCGSFQ
jgi:hypothetical protein